jgi:type I restriction enzyme M protein
LRGEVRQANSYSEDPFEGFGKFDFVMANPPFNVDDVPLATVEGDSRFNTYGVPRKKTKAKASEQGKETVPNANYLWINLFATSLKDNTPDSGRAALVMANSASDARHSEADIRKTLIENNLIYGMLTLPSNMFYTVTLPATLWFFDKNKQDDRILFIDARNIFTQIDRAHREFSEEQVQNIAIISKLRKGKRADFIRLVDSYFRKGMEQLLANREKVESVSEQLLDVLDDTPGKQAVGELVSQWQGLKALQQASDAYTEAADLQLTNPEAIETANRTQHELRAKFDPFFQQLHTGLKQLDKVVRQHEKVRAEEARQAGKRTTTDRNARRLKEALEELHKEVRSAEAYYQHIHWLQERFPNAEYEDVTGLCKLATPEEVREQDYSLNPGRYVGVVIEEDGTTEEEFLSRLALMKEEFLVLQGQAKGFENTVMNNLTSLLGE